MVINTGFSSKLLASTASYLTVEYSALLTFLKLLSVLSNSESTGSRSDLGFLCINQPLEMEID